MDLFSLLSCCGKNIPPTIPLQHSSFLLMDAASHHLQHPWSLVSAEHQPYPKPGYGCMWAESSENKSAQDCSEAPVLC